MVALVSHRAAGRTNQVFKWLLGKGLRSNRRPAIYRKLLTNIDLQFRCIRPFTGPLFPHRVVLSNTAKDLDPGSAKLRVPDPVNGTIHQDPEGQFDQKKLTPLDRKA